MLSSFLRSSDRKSAQLNAGFRKRGEQGSLSAKQNLFPAGKLLMSSCRKKVTTRQRSSTFALPSKSCICRGSLRLEQNQKTAKRLCENLSERVCGCLRRLRRGLPKLEIRDYALKSAGELSEAKTSCPLLISVLSIVPDFVVFAATELGAEATRTHALNTSSIYCFGVFVRFIQLQAPRQIQIFIS